MNSKYENQLLQCKNINEFLTMFFGLSKKEQISVLGNDYTITKETVLYRIRKDDGKTDFNAPEAWLPPPANIVKQGRFNEKNEQILYVASDSHWLEREVSLKQGEYYYLASYVCKKDFKVGSLLNSNNKISNILHCVAKSIENSSCFTEIELKEYNTEILTNITPQSIILDPLASFYIYKEVKKLYRITNKIGKLMIDKNNNGIRYCSAFEPFELTGGGVTFTLDGLQRANFALTEKGRQNIEFVKAERKCCTLDYSLDVFFKVFKEMSKENDKT